MRIKNANVFLGKSFVNADIEFGKAITAIGKLDGDADVDAQGAYLIPGLIDIHSHGAVGYDFSDADPVGIQAMADYYAAHGVTSYLATTMTLKERDLIPAMHAVRDYRRQSGAKCAGVHLEGPFLGFAKRGAQSADSLHLPDKDMFDRVNEACGNQVKLVAVACEEKGGMDFIGYVSQRAAVSLAHSVCTYEQAVEAFSRGATQVTHLFNGMEGLHHRKPGIVAAAMDADAHVELICDGQHVHPAVVRLAHKLYGDKLTMISDSLRGAGLPAGVYDLDNGRKMEIRNGCAYVLGTDTLAGSCISMLDGVRNVVRFGLPLTDAVYAASTAPALAVGLADVGSIQVGKCADLVMLDKDLNLLAVYVDGEQQ